MGNCTEESKLYTKAVRHGISFPHKTHNTFVPFLIRESDRKKRAMRSKR